MANAVKSIAKFIRKSPESEATPIFRELCNALENSAAFDMGRLYQLDKKEFEMALLLLEEWRFDRHVFDRRLQKYLDQPEEA